MRWQPTVAIVGSPTDPSGQMYATAARAAGMGTLRLTLNKALQDIRWGTSTLYHRSRADPYDASIAGARLDDRALIRVANLVVDVSYELQHYVAAMNQVWHDAGIATINPPASVWLSQNKYAAGRALVRAGVPTPRTVLAADLPEAERAAAAIGFPVVLKGVTSTHGNDVRLVRDAVAIQTDYPALRAHGQVIVQEYVAGGSDLRVLAVGGQVVGAMRRFAAPGEFRTNLARGGRSAAVTLSPAQEALAAEAAAALGLNLAGIDFVCREGGGMLCLEANCSPGLAGLRRTIGIDAAGTILQTLVRQLGR
jgi:ribosomal protein S6--L-glutamate ligase